MPLQYLTSERFEELVDHDALIVALDRAHRELALGGAVQPIPHALRDPADLAFDAPSVVPMLASAPYLGLAAAKMLVDAPRNRALCTPAQRSSVSVVSSVTGECLAVFDGRSLTRMRTAAVTALATRALARPGSRVLGLVGAGALAREHVTALLRVLSLTEVRIWSPSGTSASRLAAEFAATGLHATAVAHPDDAARGVDVLCTLAPSHEPLVSDGAVGPGTHVNAVGSPPRPGYRDLPGRLLRRADAVVVDTRAVALSESDNVRTAIANRDLDGAALIELGEILAGTARGRVSDDDVTVFNSVGIGLQDLAAAALALGIEAMPRSGAAPREVAPAAS